MESKTIASIFLCLAAIIVFCNAECCGSAGAFQGCLGHGACNIFCCNCDGGCVFNSFKSTSHHNNSGTYHPLLKNAAKLFKDADKNKDGAIDFHEAVAYAVSHEISKEKLTKDSTWFTKMDKNHDGRITPNELDKSLKH